MITQTINAQEQLLHKIATDYEQKGYHVQLHPTNGQLLPFLKEYQPDLIAESNAENVVVELNFKGKARPKEYWAELSETVSQQANWRLEIFATTELEPKNSVSIPQQEITVRLKEGRQLADSNMLDAALLMTWSATEAAMRLAGEKNGVRLWDTHPKAVISSLYMEGLLDRSDYDLLMASVEIRNRVAHGFQETDLNAFQVAQLERIALGLLQ